MVHGYLTAICPLLLSSIILPNIVWVADAHQCMTLVRDVRLYGAHVLDVNDRYEGALQYLDIAIWNLQTARTVPARLMSRLTGEHVNGSGAGQWFFRGKPGNLAGVAAGRAHQAWQAFTLGTGD